MLGYIHFDKAGIPNNRSEMLITTKNLEKILRHSFVKITNNSGAREIFLARIIEGPLYFPQEINRDSALAQTAILEGEKFPAIPNYYGSATLEIMGLVSEAKKVFSASIRPNPQSIVEKLNDEDIREILGLGEGDMLVAKLEGYEKVDIKFKSNKKEVLPRNIGIFGTVGSGKTNTSQVVIEEALENGWAVIIVDVEGEYVNMDKASDQEQLAAKLAQFDRKFKGVNKDNFQAYALINQESARSESDVQFVTIKTNQIEDYMLAEILELTEPQVGALFAIIGKAKEEMDKDWKKKQKDYPQLRGVEQETSEYTLNHLISAVDSYLAMEKSDNELNVTKASLRALRRKLERLRRTGVFDQPEPAKKINAPSLMKAGRLSVFDVSSTYSYDKNLLIAELLNKVFRAKINDPNLAKTMLVIEEAHTFISRENRDKMRETISILKDIARRGRKRWLSLCFISQQPAHLPNEIFELCNTRFIHTIKSGNNLRVLQQTAGDIADEIWRDIPSLGVGQAILDTPQFREPLKINIRPCATKRGFTD